MTAEIQATSEHEYGLRVFWEDTDAAGIVYYANYLKFCERARSEMVRAAGLDQRRLLDDDGIVFAVRRCEIDYLGAAKLDDELNVITRVLKVGGASVQLQQTVRRGQEDLVRASLRLGCVDRAGRAARMPARARFVMSAL